MDNTATRKKKVRDVINDHCIARVPSGSRELPALGGNGYYAWQFYLRRVLLDPYCLQTVCDDFWEKFEESFLATPFQLAGVESAAVPIITALIISGAQRGHKINAFTIRKDRKAYGKRNIIEGAPSDSPVFFIDDLTSPQHNALWHAIHAIDSAGLRLYPYGYVLVLKKKADESRTISTSMGVIHIHSLFTLSDFSLTLQDYDEEKNEALTLRSSGTAQKRAAPAP